MANQLVTAQIIVPDCPDWNEAEAIVRVILKYARLEAVSVKWEETIDEDEDYDE
jgi:hypothetical protein